MIVLILRSLRKRRISSPSNANNPKNGYVLRFTSSPVMTRWTPVSDRAADASIDAVVIATPTITHVPLVRAALAAGKHVLVEKPIATRAEEGAALCELAEKAGRVLMVGHVFLYNGAVREVKKRLDEGFLGRVYYLSMVRTNLGPIRMDVNASWDLAAHDVSRLESTADGLVITISGRDPYLHAAILAQAGNLLACLGRFDESEPYLARSLAQYEHAQQRPAGSLTNDPKVMLLFTRGLVEWLRGRPSEALRSLDSATEHADRLGHPFSRAMIRLYRAPLALLVRHRLRAVWIASAWLFHVGVLALMAIGFPYPLAGIAFASMVPLERLAARVPVLARRIPSLGATPTIGIDGAPAGVRG